MKRREGDVYRRKDMREGEKERNEVVGERDESEEEENEEKNV